MIGQIFRVSDIIYAHLFCQQNNAALYLTWKKKQKKRREMKLKGRQSSEDGITRKTSWLKIWSTLGQENTKKSMERQKTKQKNTRRKRGERGRRISYEHECDHASSLFWSRKKRRTETKERYPYIFIVKNPTKAPTTEAESSRNIFFL